MAYGAGAGLVVGFALFAVHRADVFRTRGSRFGRLGFVLRMVVFAGIKYHDRQREREARDEHIFHKKLKLRVLEIGLKSE